MCSCTHAHICYYLFQGGQVSFTQDLRVQISRTALGAIPYLVASRPAAAVRTFLVLLVLKMSMACSGFSFIRSADFRFKNVSGRINRKSALCSCILFSGAEVIHRPRSNFLLHFNIQNIYQIRTEK